MKLKVHLSVRKVDAMVLHQLLIGMCGCFHHLTFVWKYLFCFRVEIWASSQRALVLCNHCLPAEQFRLKKCLPTPVNKIGHLIESRAMSPAPSPSLPSTTSSLHLLSALHQMRLPFLLWIKTIPASLQRAWKPLHRAWALNESHARSVCFGRQEYFEGLN